MEPVPCPRKVERRIGKLEAFNAKPGETQARVRVGKTVFNLPAMSRGVLQQDDDIVLCANGNRYEVIAEGTLIAMDLIFNAEDKNPCPGVWAPKLGPLQLLWPFSFAVFLLEFLQKQPGEKPMRYVRFMERFGGVFIVVAFVAAFVYDYSENVAYALVGADVAAGLVSMFVVHYYYRKFLRDLKQAVELWAATVGINRDITDPLSWPVVGIMLTAKPEELIRVILEGDVQLTQPVEALLASLTDITPAKGWRYWGEKNGYHSGALQLA